ncbi:glycosyltransferase [Aeromonas allosaccharophila]|uniref:glycosyltransferase n=1 Tax=Aeromonas allosaccharophila TaxID=656 RepID=UPI0030072BE2
MKTYFCGSYFSQDRYQEIISNSKGGVSNANDLFQKNIINGLSQYYNEFQCVTLPNIGSYPKSYNKVFLKGSESSITFGGGAVSSLTLPFINIKYIKHFFRFFSLLVFFLRSLKRNEHVLIYYYDCDFAFVLMARVLKILGYKNKNCLIIPDLPTMTGSENPAASILDVLLKTNLKFFDSYAAISKGVIEKLNLDSEKSIVLEGIYNKELYSSMISSRKDRDHVDHKTIFYSGAIDERNGVKLLINAFNEIKKNYTLIIIGDGPLKAWVMQQCKLNSSIKYLGQRSHLEVIRIQKEVDLLINPRMPNQSFTPYSFPSKTMEYLASGIPLLMFKLEGVPNEYFKYVNLCEGVSVDELAKSIESVLELDYINAIKIAHVAKKFILEKKNPYVQCGKLFKIN